MKPIDVGKHMLAQRNESDDGWLVTTKRKEILGTIERNERWRQFEFVPDTGTAYTHDCLAAMSVFLRQLNAGMFADGGGA